MAIPQVNSTTLKNYEKYLIAPSAMKYWTAQSAFRALGAGGCDIVILGDSHVQLAGPEFWNLPYVVWWSQVRKKVQAALNPPGVDGGLGFINFARPRGAKLVPPFAITNINMYNDQVTADGGGNPGSASMPNVVQTNDPNSLMAIEYKFNDTLAQRNQISAFGTAFEYFTDLEVLFFRQSGLSNAKLSIDTGSGYGAGVGTYSTSSGAWGTLWRAGARDLRPSGYLHIDPGKPSYQATMPTGDIKVKIESTQTGAGKYVQAEGFMHYRKDYESGVRFWMFGKSGQAMTTFASNATDFSPGATGATGELLSTIDQDAFNFFRSAQCLEGASVPDNKRPCLFIICFGINEYSNQTTLSGSYWANGGVTRNRHHPTTLKNALINTITRINTQLAGQLPTILPIIYWAHPGVNDATAANKWDAYVQAYYDACAPYKNVCPLDLDLAHERSRMTDGISNKFFAERNWTSTHMAGGQGAWLADLVAAPIIGYASQPTG